jgi:hypothetical protein
MKLLLLVAARSGVGGSFDDAVRRTGQAFAEALPTGSVTVLRALGDDVFALATPAMRPFDATIEVIGDSLDAAMLTGVVRGVGDTLFEVAHTDLSGVLVGVDNVVIPCEPAPVRYQYCMRRKAGSTHEQYLDYYANHHKRFGFVTPGIDGYVQFHVDLAATRDAAAAAGVGTWAIDSVSELHMQSLEGFLAALAAQNPGEEALVDEERFVDRRNSVSFTSAVLWRS